MIADKIHAYLRGDGEPSPERIAWARAIVGDDALRSFTRCFLTPEKERNAGRAPVSASSHFYCARNLFYLLTGAPKEEPQPRAKMVFHLGDNVETMAVALAILAGVPVLTPKEDGRQREAFVTFDGQEIPCHQDMTIGYMGAECPVEVKSMSEWGWDKSREEGVDDTFGYVTQLQIYMAALRAPRGFFLGVNKSTGHVFEEEVVYDPRVVDAAQDAYRHARLGVSEQGAPPRPEWAKVKQIAGTEQIDAVRCSYCAFRPVCWPGYEPKLVSGKAVFRRPLAVSPNP